MFILKRMKLLPEQIDLFTFTSGAIAAFSSLVAILIAIGEATKSRRIDNQLSRIQNIIDNEEHSERIRMLKNRRLELEASLYARGSLSGTYLLWGTAGTIFPIARFVASYAQPRSLGEQITVAILLVLMCFLLVENILDNILRRKAIEVRYIAGKNPAEELGGLKAFALLRSMQGLIFCTLWTISLSFIVLYLMFSKWNGHSLQSTIITLFLFIVAAVAQSQPAVTGTKNAIIEIAIQRGALK
ncbi:Uncharacterised protein [Corynebacterium ulcerans]|uniref:DUF2721 domain-containing protein n=2 Tax=Corynebacterium ulcerans TaxID=65058 RepID=A0ABD7MPK4_CORUL|nr:Uncharacterised protein [Corynebacterium ulcerans]